MSYPVFISYARASSADHARALKARLGDLAFLDTDAIDDGDVFPERLMEGILGARVVVIFASGVYLTRRFCRLEMELALALGDVNKNHIVMALGDGCGDVLAVVPRTVEKISWPVAGETERLVPLVDAALAGRAKALGDGVSATEARRLAVAFWESSQIPEAIP